jgi:hypothetical protein
MPDTKTTRPTVDADNEQDVEGNSMLIGPTISADLARGHRRDLELAARKRARAKEARQTKGR